MSKWIRKDDKVVVIAGNDRGKTGIVLARKKDRVIVQGINIRKKHLKRRDQEAKAEIASIEAALHISNVAFCGSDDKPVKVRVRTTESGGKELFAMDQGKEKVIRTLKK